jgi:hypothetical protein
MIGLCFAMVSYVSYVFTIKEYLFKVKQYLLRKKYIDELNKNNKVINNVFCVHRSLDV